MSRLGEKLCSGRFVITAEVDPPRGTDPAALVNRVGRLAGKVDAVNVTDCPRANVRMSPITASSLVQKHTGVETIFHFTCRDRNVIAIQAELLGACALGLSNVLVLAGDPPEQGNHPGAKPVFEVDTPSLIRLIADLNQGYMGSGGTLKDGPTDFLIAAAANPSAPDQQRELARLAEKVEAGADFVQTQPVFDPKTAIMFEESLEAAGLEVPVLYGIMPLRDEAAAKRMSAIPGVRIPDAVMARLVGSDSAAGAHMAAELAAALYHHVRGIHIFPMGTDEVVLDIVAAVEERRALA